MGVNGRYEQSKLLPLPNSLEVVEKLAQLNQAYTQFYMAQTRSERNEADQTFNDCFDWFTLHYIPIHQDSQTQNWLSGLITGRSKYEQRTP
jgi:hypothetical protein